MKNEMNLEKKSLYDNNCPIFYTLNLIGAKWKLPILWCLQHHESLHYNELKRQVSGITNTMLTKCLRELEADHLISRHQYHTTPPSVAYKLTDKGASLLPALNELYRWGATHMDC